MIQNNIQINLMNDCLFKALLRSSEARRMVATFLSSITGIDLEILMNATYISGELPKKREYEKKKSTDVLVLIDNHNRIIIEMNQYKSDNIFNKNTSYAISNILELNKINDEIYPRVTIINIDNFNQYNTKLPILSFKIRDEENHIENELYTSIHLILANLVNNQYNKNVGEEIRKFSKFLKTKTLEELKEAFEGDDEYMASIDKIEDLIMDPSFAGAYDLEERRNKEMLDFKLTGLRIGREEGIHKGREEGRKEGINERNIEIAKAMVKDEVNVETISKYTGLSVKEITNLES